VKAPRRPVRDEIEQSKRESDRRDTNARAIADLQRIQEAFDFWMRQTES